MNAIFTLFAFLSVTFISPLQADDGPVDCFYEINARHPDCKK